MEEITNKKVMMKKAYTSPVMTIVPMGPEMPVAYTQVKTDGLGDDIGQGSDDTGGGSSTDPIFGDVKGNVDLWSDEW